MQCIADSGCFYVPYNNPPATKCCHKLDKGEFLPEKHRLIYGTPDPLDAMAIVWTNGCTDSNCKVQGGVNHGLSYRETSVSDAHKWTIEVSEPGGVEVQPITKKVHTGVTLWQLV